MKCADARHLIHLSAGDDTLADEEQAVSEHLHECSDCRAYHAGMVDAMQALCRMRDGEVGDPTASVWPSVRRAIRSTRAGRLQQPHRQFNGGIVVLCACSIVLALVTIVRNLPASSSDVTEVPVPRIPMQVGWGRRGLPQMSSQLPIPPTRVMNSDGSTRGFQDPATGNWLYVPQITQEVRPGAGQRTVEF